MVDESSIYGREHDKKELIELLLSEAIGNGISVIPIVGKGGLGKTTIAQLVYRDSEVKKYFDLTGWVCVSGDFDVKRLTKDIIKSLTQSSDNKKNEEKKVPSLDLPPLSTLQNDLKKKLEGKKVLLVLDDVWNEQQSLWESLRKPFVGAETAVRIIVTCRNGKVAEIMQTVSPHHPGILCEDESWLLFKHYAFGGLDSQRQFCFEDIGKQIVQKCSGLPLAVKFIGSSLRHEEDEDKWNEFLQSELWEVDENNEILPALKLSYDRMPVHLKPCFVYCSIFPKDTEFEKDNLVEMWMAQGYILPRGTRRMEDIGDEYFIDLQRRSFFDPDGDGLYKMHDVIHDLAKFAAGNEYYASVDEKLPISPDKVRHLYVKDDEELVKSPNSYDSYNPDALRTLLLYDEYRDKKVPIQNIIRFPLLRCLEFHWTRKSAIQDLLGNLKHLRYLNITSIDIEKLPESVCLLYHLQTLKLACYSLLELPYGLGNLTNLRHLHLEMCCIERLPESFCQLDNLQKLYIGECNDLIGLPSGIGSLTNLRHLDMYDTLIHSLPAGISKLTNLQISFKNFKPMLFVNSEGQCGIGVLKNFVNLQGHLYISGLGNLVNIDDVSDAGLEYKHELEELSLDWHELDEDYFRDDLNTLHVRVEWNHADHSKNGLHLEASLEENKDIPVDEEIHEAMLEHLQPHANLKSLTIDGYGGSRFPKWLGNHDSLKMVYIFSCPQLTSMAGLHNLHSLTNLEIYYCPQLQVLSEEGLPSKLEKLHIEKCQQLTSLTGMQNLTSLGALTIMYCPKLQIMAEDQLSPMPDDVRIVGCPGLGNWCQIQKINCIQVFTEETENEETSDGTQEKQGLNCVMIEHANSVVSPISDAKDDCEMSQFLQLGLPSGCSSQYPEQITAEPLDARIRRLEMEIEEMRQDHAIDRAEMHAQMQAMREHIERLTSMLQMYAPSQAPGTSCTRGQGDDHPPADD